MRQDHVDPALESVHHACMHANSQRNREPSEPSQLYKNLVTAKLPHCVDSGMAICPSTVHSRTARLSLDVHDVYRRLSGQSLDERPPDTVDWGQARLQHVALWPLGGPPLVALPSVGRPQAVSHASPARLHEHFAAPQPIQ